ncbi:MAG: efflux RND transporter permease subunit [Phycisphaerales bacterium]|nr:efflux RND transporter permease subunit [Phycisphaerales bacterium]
MSIASFGVRRPVAANLVMLALIGAGLVFGVGLRREFFPALRTDKIIVAAPYPGASPQEVEDSLARKIEDRLSELDDVDELTTTIGEGFCNLIIEFAASADIDEKLFEVKREIDALQDLPQESERIVVTKLEPNLPVCILALYGDADERTVKDAVREMQSDLRSLPGMGEVAVSGLRTDEITVAVKPEQLIRHGLSLPMIADVIRRQMRELPSGAVRSNTQNVSIRMMGADERVDEVRQIVVKASGEGQALRLEEIADVRAGFEDVDLYQRLNGHPSGSLTVFKVGKQDAVEMAAMVKAYAAARRGEPFVPTLGERVRKAMRRPGDAAPASDRELAYRVGQARPNAPPGDLVITTDLSRFIVGRLDLLKRNALQGGALVLLSLVLLLNGRVAFWTALGLVVSLLATLAAMHFADYSLNLLTMFGLIIVIGLLVDDAIVVAENIVSWHERGARPKEAAITGTNQVSWPVVATVLTTICAFLPLALIKGQIGDMLGALPVVVALALAVSLIEALFILPSHMAHSLKAEERGSGNQSVVHRAETAFDRAREHVIQSKLIPAYLWVLRKCVRMPYLTVAIAIAVFIVSISLVVGGRVPFRFMDSSDAETINIEIRMPIGTPTAETDVVARQFEQAARALPEVASVWAQVGAIGSLNGDQPDTNQSHIGQVILELLPVESRERSAEDVKNAVRAGAGDLVGVESVRIEEVAGGPSGAPFTFAVAGEQIDTIMQVVQEIKAALRDYQGVRDIADDASQGRRELRVTLLDGARELGLTTESVAQQIRGAVYGLEAHTFAGDREDVDVRVMLDERTRRSLARIETMHVLTPDGRAVPLSEVASVAEAEGYASIRRLNRERVVTVTADADATRVNPEEVTRDLRPALEEIAARHAGVRILERGRQKELRDSMGSLPIGMLVASGLNFMILAWLFSSYLQPIVVLLTVPFATVGMIWGHLILGFDMTILSLIGFIALSGVVVNDSLIFITTYNRLRAMGLTVFEACMATGQSRLRAVMLTTITTVLGLMPLMLEQSFQARFLIPMAITISCGLISSTVLVLLIIPALLMIGQDVKRGAAWLWTGGAVRLNIARSERPNAIQEALANDTGA